MKVIYKTHTFGNVKEHGCLTGMTNLLNKLVDEHPKGRNKARYIAHLIARYHSMLHIVSNAKGSINVVKKNILDLVYRDYRRRVVAQELPTDLETHIICFLDGLYKGKLDVIRNSKK